MRLAIEAHGLTKEYDGLRAVDALDLFDGVPLPLQATLHRPATCLSSSTTRIRIRPEWQFRLKSR